MKIGIFDSGYGGRFTLKKCQALLPPHEFIGFFDHANAPYGNRSAEEIYHLTEAGINKLFDQNCDLVLVACNTAASQSLRQLQEDLPHKKMLGCLVPAIESSIEAGGNHIGIIATTYTVETKKYQREAFKVDPAVKVFPVATPKLVPWIEAGKQDSQECQTYLAVHIQNLIENHQIDTLILGCTHYSVLKMVIEKAFPQLKIIDSAEAQAEKLVDYLERHTELQ